MEIFQRGYSKAKGTYKEYKVEKGHLSAVVVCPNCGNPMSLINHQIRDHGKVLPLVACTLPGCDFRDYIQLENWNHYVDLNREGD